MRCHGLSLIERRAYQLLLVFKMRKPIAGVLRYDLRGILMVGLQYYFYFENIYCNEFIDMGI